MFGSLKTDPPPSTLSHLRLRQPTQANFPQRRHDVALERWSSPPPPPLTSKLALFQRIARHPNVRTNSSLSHWNEIKVTARQVMVQVMCDEMCTPMLNIFHCACSKTSYHGGKSLYDVLSKGSAGSRQDSRSAVEISIVADSLAKAGPLIGGCRILRCPRTVSRRRSWSRKMEPWST